MPALISGIYITDGAVFPLHACPTKAIPSNNISHQTGLALKKPTGNYSLESTTDNMKF